MNQIFIKNWNTTKQKLDIVDLTIRGAQLRTHATVHAKINVPFCATDTNNHNSFYDNLELLNIFS